MPPEIAIELRQSRFKLLEGKFFDQVEPSKLRRINTKVDWDFYVAKYQWYLAKSPLIAYYPKGCKVWENAYIAFFHASMNKNETF